MLGLELPEGFTNKLNAAKRKSSLDEPLAGFQFEEKGFIETALSEDYEENEYGLFTSEGSKEFEVAEDTSKDGLCASAGDIIINEILSSPPSEKEIRKLVVTRSMPDIHINEAVGYTMKDIELNDPYEQDI